MRPFAVSLILLTMTPSIQSEWTRLFRSRILGHSSKQLHSDKAHQANANEPEANIFSSEKSILEIQAKLDRMVSTLDTLGEEIKELSPKIEGTEKSIKNLVNLAEDYGPVLKESVKRRSDASLEYSLIGAPERISGSRSGTQSVPPPALIGNHGGPPPPPPPPPPPFSVSATKFRVVVPSSSLSTPPAPQSVPSSSKLKNDAFRNTQTDNMMSELKNRLKKRNDSN